MNNNGFFLSLPIDWAFVQSTEILVLFTELEALCRSTCITFATDHATPTHSFLSFIPSAPFLVLLLQWQHSSNASPALEETLTSRTTTRHAPKSTNTDLPPPASAPIVTCQIPQPPTARYTGTAVVESLTAAACIRDLPVLRLPLAPRLVVG